MSKVTIDFSDAYSVREIVPEGIYEAQCTNVELKKTKNEDKTYLAFTMLTAEGSVIVNKFIGGNDRNSFMRQFLLGLGFDADELDGQIVFDADLCRGKKCFIRVRHEEKEYNGRLQTNVNVNWIWRHDDPAVKEINAILLKKVATPNRPTVVTSADNNEEVIPF